MNVTRGRYTSVSQRLPFGCAIPFLFLLAGLCMLIFVPFLWPLILWGTTGLGWLAECSWLAIIAAAFIALGAWKTKHDPRRPPRHSSGSPGPRDWSPGEFWNDGRRML
jgi:hypothetical protein